ncbi:ubiquitin-protein ligase [Lithospermum erythrorhizon]|uniref:E3 ubiquitin-protein ligase RMA n=1 Tax=Lithospermum erythrorhizon TaxID=34254 RepID=A0AAV3Q437_LITER
MDNSSSDGVVTGLDLNEEPRELLPSYQVLIDQLGSTQSRIDERIRQLGEVIERARNFRQQVRSSHDLIYPSAQSFVINSHEFLEMTRNVGNESGESSRVDDVDVMETNNGIGRKYKRNSIQLVARALAIYPETRRVDKERVNFYDCNVCLQMAENPILTCCGHLFCWACFYTLPPQDSSSKECPVCMGEVSDHSIIPIYGNGNHSDALKTESTFEVPPRPKAQRIESGRQMRTTHGLSVPVSEALHRLRTIIGTTGDHLSEIPTLEHSNYNVAAQSGQTHHQGLRVSSVNSSSLPNISADLADAEGIVDEIGTYIGARPWRTRTSVSDRQTHIILSSNYHDPPTVNDAVVQADNQSLNSTDTAPSWRTSDIVDAAVQLGNLTNGTSSIANRLSQQSSSSTRRRSRRLLDADRSSSHQSSRRRLH